LTVHRSQVPQAQSLRFSIYDGFFYALMVGFGETYFSAYALFLGANNFQMGVLASVPPLVAGLSQFWTPRLFRLTHSRKRLVCLGVALQLLALIPIAAAHRFTLLPFEFFIASVSLYFTGNALVGPVWNSWMADLVSGKKPGVYFGRRNRVVTVGTFASLVAGGFILRIAKANGYELEGFLCLMTLAIAARGVSLYFLTRKGDPPSFDRGGGSHGFFKFATKLPQENQGMLIIFMAAINFAVLLSAAYYTPHLLRELKFNYTTYMIILSGVALSKFISSRFWGEITDQLGVHRAVQIAGILMIFSNVTWLWARSPVILFFSQCFTGFVWAGYELSTFTFLLQATAPHERSRISSYANIIIAISGFTGGMLGAWLVTKGPHPLHPFFLVFITSAILRAAAVLIITPRLKQVIDIAPVRARDVIFKATGFKSAWGLTSRLVILPRLAQRRRRQRRRARNLKPEARSSADGASQKSAPTLDAKKDHQQASPTILPEDHTPQDP
jgi:MFS family permease